MGKIKSVPVITIDDRRIVCHPPDKEHPQCYPCWVVPDVRDSVIAPPGYKILGADYSQIEVRIMAQESGDKWLIEALNSGKDIHCYMAADVNNIPYDLFYKAYKDENDPMYEEYYAMRSDIKTTTFGVPLNLSGIMERSIIKNQVNSGKL